MNELRPISEMLPRPRRRRSTKGLSPDDASLSERDELVLELVQVGIGVRKAESLVSSYPHDQIRQQLRWLPFRAARRRASLLIASIENNYDEPPYAAD
ncbi:MAG: hypothetical protein M9921_10110 [Fimbriimonadaceae bacterium]|nr:hypothetical protein [Fimbriimonadaceae bacterium]